MKGGDGSHGGKVYWVGVQKGVICALRPISFSNKFAVLIPRTFSCSIV